MKNDSRKGFGRRHRILVPPEPTPPYVSMHGPEPGESIAAPLADMTTLAEVLRWEADAFAEPTPEELATMGGCDTVIWRGDRVAAVIFSHGRPDQKVVINPYVPQGEKGADR
jgi:hypothetical protein